jgi:hypothetical protein
MFLALTACQTTDIKQAYVDPTANLGAADAPRSPSQPAVAIQPEAYPQSPSSGDLNSTSWVELRMAEAPPRAAARPMATVTSRSPQRPLALLGAPGELMNPSEFPTRFLAKQ